MLFQFMNRFKFVLLQDCNRASTFSFLYLSKDDSGKLSLAKSNVTVTGFDKIPAQNEKILLEVVTIIESILVVIDACRPGIMLCRWVYCTVSSDHESFEVWFNLSSPVIFQSSNLVFLGHFYSIWCRPFQLECWTIQNSPFAC